MKNNHRLLFISLIFGAITGSLLHLYQDQTWSNHIVNYFFQPVGQLFLRLVFMVVIPMVISGLFMGVTQLSSHHGLTNVFKKTLLFTLITSTASVVIGVGLTTLFQPGVNAISTEILSQLKTQDQIQSISQNASSVKSFSDIIVSLVPKNPIESAAKAFDGEMIALMIFALIFGVAYSKTKKTEEQDKIFCNWSELIYDTCLSIVQGVMKYAPIAVFALIASTTFKYGHQIIFSLGSYIAVVVIALLLQQFLVYSILLKFFSNYSPLEFFKKCRPVYLCAFATASSNATLPTTLETAEHNLKLSPAISRFVLTIGSTANQNGTALFEGVTVLFLAQVFNIDLSITQQFTIVVMSIIAGIGTAGVPGGSLPLIMILLGQVGIPPEGIALILGVDRFLDMCRTTINVSGDLVIAAIVDNQSKKILN